MVMIYLEVSTMTYEATHIGVYEKNQLLIFAKESEVSHDG